MIVDILEPVPGYAFFGNEKNVVVPDELGKQWVALGYARAILKPELQVSVNSPATETATTRKRK